MSDVNDHKVSIRQANLAEAEVVHAAIPEFEPTYIRVKYVTKNVAQKAPYILIAQLDGKDVGYMIGYDEADAMYIWLTGTLPKYRQYGVFKTMLAELSAEAIRRGRTQLTVKSYERFQPMLQALAKAGFERVGLDGEGILLAKEL